MSIDFICNKYLILHQFLNPLLGLKLDTSPLIVALHVAGLGEALATPGTAHRPVVVAGSLAVHVQGQGRLEALATVAGPGPFGGVDDFVVAQLVTEAEAFGARPTGVAPGSGRLRVRRG